MKRCERINNGRGSTLSRSTPKKVSGEEKEKAFLFQNRIKINFLPKESEILIRLSRKNKKRKIFPTEASRDRREKKKMRKI